MTPHGPVTTPTLMPVVNPNIQIFTPREMREKFGTSMVITNSYVIHKHDALREKALKSGVHSVLDWDGPLMTDSGTFQMYVYGDVQVGADEIVQFQRDIGVDVATCLDLFVTPDMDRTSAEKAVATTIERTKSAVAHKGSSLLNATVQGGIHLDLRKACAHAYRDLDIDYHTIGGVVPVMEQQMYPELVEMILWSQSELRKDRPVHLFGAGHPLVFPLAVALGCDLFDSSSYAKYAKDGRMMFEWGTAHLDELTELPCHCPVCAKTDAASLRALPVKDRERALAEHNLHISFSDLRRIRTAIKEGSLWELVEQRAACHPMLAAATRKLGDPIYQKWLEQREPVSYGRALRYTGALTHHRPIFRRIRERLQHRVIAQGQPTEILIDSDFAKKGQERLELGMHKEPRNKPYAASLGSLDPDMDHAVMSPLGPVPVGLDETYPFAQSVVPRLEGLDRGHMGWVGETKDLFLAAHDFVPAIPGPGGRLGTVDTLRMQVIRTLDWQFGAGAGEALTGGVGSRVETSDDRVGGGGAPITTGVPLTSVVPMTPPVPMTAGRGGTTLASSGRIGHGGADSRLRIETSKATGKIRTVYLDDVHILSLRAGDALFSLKAGGAALLHKALAAPANRIVVAPDSVPFNRAGKSVMCQFVRACDPDLRPYDECLVVDERDELVAVGQLMLAPDEIQDFRKGMAVKVREGIQP